MTVNAPFCDDPYSHTRRAAARLDLGGLVLGGDEPVRVEIDHGRLPGDSAGLAAAVATGLGLVASDLACESHRVGVAFEKDLASVEAFARALEPLGALRPIAVGLPIALAGKAARIAGVASRVVLPVDRAADAEALSDAAVELRAAGLSVELQVVAGPDERPAATLLERVDTALQAADEVDPLLLSVASPRATHAARIVAARLREHGSDAPLGLCFTPLRADAGGSGDSLLDAAVDLGAPLCDGIGDLVSLPTAAFGGDTARTLDVAYRILQGARLRTTRTEYISCPSCGRTLFDLEETTARIKARTNHLKGVKIAVMGCIVNGPGEMADADFGYVGSGPGVVTLYVGKEIVVRAVPETEAPDRLVELIRERGHWREADA